MPYQLVIVQGRSTAKALPLGAGVTNVGRQEDCQLRIKSSQVSRKHCQFFEKKGMLIVKDLGSSNGTFVNGKKVKDQRVLEPGDELTIGSVKLRVEKVGAPAAKLGTVASKRAADTAVAEAVVIAEDDVIGDDAFELELEEQTQTSIEPPKPPPAPSKPKPVFEADDPPVTAISEDAVAEFLLDLEIDENDK